MNPLEERILDLTEERGPLTGSEILQAMEQASYLFRKKAEEHLLSESVQTIKDSALSLFYPVEESEEFSLF